jgi:hypothetical protein
MEHRTDDPFLPSSLPCVLSLSWSASCYDRASCCDGSVTMARSWSTSCCVLSLSRLSFFLASFCDGPMTTARSTAAAREASAWRRRRVPPAGRRPRCGRAQRRSSASSSSMLFRCKLTAPRRWRRRTSSMRLGNGCTVGVAYGEET